MTDAKPTPPEAQPRLDLLLDLLAEAREEARWKGVLLAEAAKSRDDALRTIEGNVAEYQEQRQLLMVANGLAAEAAEECNRLRAELALERAQHEATEKAQALALTKVQTETDEYRERLRRIGIAANSPPSQWEFVERHVISVLKDKMQPMQVLLDAERRELEQVRGELAQEQRRRERAEAERDNLRKAPRALPWRDAKTDPPADNKDYPVRYVDGMTATASRDDDGDWWSDDRGAGDCGETPTHWLPLSALEQECVTVDLPAVSDISVTPDWWSVTCGYPIAAVLRFPAPDFPLKWKGQPLTLTLTVRR